MEKLSQKYFKICLNTTGKEVGAVSDTLLGKNPDRKKPKGSYRSIWTSLPIHSKVCCEKLH